MRTNYAFPQHEQYQLQKYKEHRDKESFHSKDNVDGKTYVWDCLHFFVRAGERTPPAGKKFEFGTPPERTITSLDENVTIWLELFASDAKTGDMKDHLPKNHPQNRSCKPQGDIRFVIPSTELRQLGLKHRRVSHKKDAAKYYTIEYHPVITIQGRNLRYELWFRDNMRVEGELEIAPESLELTAAAAS